MRLIHTPLGPVLTDAKQIFTNHDSESCTAKDAYAKAEKRFLKENPSVKSLSDASVALFERRGIVKGGIVQTTVESDPVETE